MLHLTGLTATLAADILEVMTAGHDESTTPGTAPPAATDEERAAARTRMRRKLAEARQRHDADYWARLREQLGLPARTA